MRYRCSCFGGPSVDRKKGTAAGTLHGIDGENFVNYLTRFMNSTKEEDADSNLYPVMFVL